MGAQEYGETVLQDSLLNRWNPCLFFLPVCWWQTLLLWSRGSSRRRSRHPGSGGLSPRFHRLWWGGFWTFWSRGSRIRISLLFRHPIFDLRNHICFLLLSLRFEVVLAHNVHFSTSFQPGRDDNVLAPHKAHAQALHTLPKAMSIPKNSTSNTLAPPLPAHP